MEENMTLDMAKAIMANPVEYSNEEIKKAVAVYNAELTKIQNDKTMDAKTKENTIEEYDQFFKAFFKAFEDINKHADELARPEVDFEKAKYDSLRLSQAYFRAATPTDERKAAVNRLNAAMLAKLQAMDKSQPIEDSELSAIEEFIGRTDDAEIKSELQNLVAELKSDYDYENGLNANPEDLISRDEKADEALRNIHLYDENGEPTEDFKDMGELVDRISFTDEKGDVNARKKEIVDKMFSAAKLDAHRESISDVDFLVKNDEERHRDLVDRIKDHFTHKVAAASVADQFREIRPDDVADEDSFEKYMEERDKAARAAMDNIVNSTSPINIKEKDAIIAVADSEVDTEKFVRRLEYRTKTDSKIKASWQKLREGAKRLWGQRYEFTRGVIKSIKDNKWQHITNVLATGAMWVTMSLNAHWAVPAIAGYAVYSAAGNYIWPVLRERKELCEKAKKEGKKLGFFASLKQAWKNKKDDKKFRIRGRFGLVAGATGAVLGLGGTLSAVSNALGLSGAVSSPAGVALMRKGLGLLRAAGGLSAQSMVLNWAKKDFKKDPSDKNRRELHNARLSFGVSLAGSLWASWLFGKNTFNDVAGNGVEGNGGSENDLGANDGGKGSPGGGNTTPAGPVVDLDSLTADEKSMYNNSILKFGGGDKARGIEVVKRYLDSFAAGNVDSLPKGMSPVQYIDAMNRLSQYHAHPEAVKLMFQDLDCPDFKPTAEQKEMIAKALQDIHYTRGMMDVIVFDECKNPRVMKAPMFGQYFGEQKYFTYVDPVSGQERVLPVRTLNYTGKVEGIVDCEKGATVLHGKIKYATLPCDKLVETPEEKVQPIEVVQEPPAPVLPDFEGGKMVENTSGFRIQSPIDTKVGVAFNDNTSGWPSSITQKEFYNSKYMQALLAEYKEKAASGEVSLDDPHSLTKLSLIKHCSDNRGEFRLFVPKDAEIQLDNGTVVANNQSGQINLKQDGLIAFLREGAYTNKTAEKTLQAGSDIYKQLVETNDFEFKGDNGNRSEFLTGVVGAENLSMPKPVNWDGSEIGSVMRHGQTTSLSIGSDSGPITIKVDAKGIITATTRDGTPVVIAPESQQQTAQAIETALRNSGQYANIGHVDLSAPDGTLSQKCLNARSGNNINMAYNSKVNPYAIGRVTGRA